MHIPCPPAELPAELVVVAYEDPVIERLGFGPDDPYIEQCWVAIVGPSASWMWRRLARVATKTGIVPAVVNTTDLLLSIGLGEGLRKNSLGARTVARLVAFDLAKQGGRDGSVLAVRRALPQLCERQARHLPLSVRTYHDNHNQ
jgi:hypothetical protein